MQLLGRRYGVKDGKWVDFFFFQKKGDFSLPGSKEKQMKSMMDKWKSFKEDI